jgi:hypothetical protein
MTQPNEYQCYQKLFDPSAPINVSKEKIVKIHKIRNQRRRKSRTICINTCIILEKGIQNPDKKVIYQKFSQFINKSKDFEGKNVGEIV